VAASLVAGVPLLLAPRYREQEETARRAVRMGAGTKAALDASAQAMRQVLDELFDTYICKDGATKFRAAHPGYSPITSANCLASGIDIVSIAQLLRIRETSGVVQ